MVNQPWLHSFATDVKEGRAREGHAFVPCSLTFTIGHACVRLASVRENPPNPGVFAESALRSTRISMAMELPRVLLAFSSRAVAERLNQQWLLDHDIISLGITTEGAEAARWILELQPGTILCDDHILRHPDLLGLLAQQSTRSLCRVVLVTPDSGTEVVPEAIPISASLDMNMDAGAAARHLHELLEPPTSRVTMGPSPQPESGGTQRLLRRVVLDPEPEVPLLPDQPRIPRGRDPLSILLQTIQRDKNHPRDTVTGLATGHTLDRVLAALPALEEPAAVVVIALWGKGATTPLPLDMHPAATLRTVAAILRTHVRHDDLVCRLEEQGFAIILPHPGSNAHQVPRRLRTALDNLRRSNLADRSGPAISMGFGFWEPGLPSSYPLEQAWRAARSDRDQRAPAVPSNVPGAN